MRTRAFLLAAAFAVMPFHLAPSALAHETKIGNLLIEHAWSRPSPMAANVAAGFMKIVNTGKEDDRLVSVTSDIAGTVQLHDMKMEGDVMKMSEIQGGIPIPAGETVELKPGSLHIMFMGVKKQPDAGAYFNGTLTFEKAGTVAVEYEVQKMGH